jgi:hypothetical protein
MQAWNRLWAKPAHRFLLIAGLLVISFSALLIEPLMVRTFGEPVSLRVRGFASPGFDSFFQLPITEVPLEELSPDLQAVFLLDSMDEAALILREYSYYLELAEVNGVFERVGVHTTRPDGPYITATFSWFLWNDNRVEGITWQDRYNGIQLDIPHSQRFFVPANTPESTIRALQEGTWVADFRLYRGQLYLIDPKV